MFLFLTVSYNLKGVQFTVLHNSFQAMTTNYKFTEYHDVFLQCSICKHMLWLGKEKKNENGIFQCGGVSHIRRTIDVSNYWFVSSEKNVVSDKGKEHLIIFADKIRYTFHFDCYKNLVKQNLSPDHRKHN